MHRNSTWLALLVVVVGLALFFGVKASLSLSNYYALSEQIPVEVHQWEIVDVGRDNYFLIANYSFDRAGKTYGGSGRVGYIYRNPWSAEKGLEQFRDAKLRAWVNPKKPEKMALVKNYPYKMVLSALVLAGLALYFIFLGLYVGNQKG
ncbi:MAG: hypothetical protein ACKVOH_06905 [Chlamydiales bacterium]